MSEYYFAKIVNKPIDETDELVREALEKEGFGVLTEIDVAATLKKKLDVGFRPYRILGACNPEFAHKALSAEDKIGTMLPCNVILQATSDDKTEVAAVDPMASMASIENARLEEIAKQVRARLQRVVSSL